LNDLTIGGYCEELDAFPSLSSIQHLHTSLKYLELYGWAKLNSLLDQIQFFTSIIYLSICEFDGIEALPEWFSNLFSLESLHLCDCMNLMYLPTKEAMRRLTKLEELHIDNCPKLKQRCAKGSGVECSKIAHIPIIRINRYFIKDEPV
jgi:hypothetical protein